MLCFTFLYLFCSTTPLRADLVEDIEDLESPQPRIQSTPGPQSTERDKPAPLNSPTKIPQQSRAPGPATEPRQTPAAKKFRSRSNRLQKVDFESDSLRALKGQQQIMLTGHVLINQGGFRLEANEATIYFKKKSREPYKVVAKGGVKVFQADTKTTSRMTAQCSEAVFFNAERKVVLRGSAKLWHGDDFVSGKQITYELDTGWIKAERVEGVVLPGGKQ